ncbi:MAG: hypothetical protein SF187_07330 [Deltaproteobacteria bacterium]|nr:hypothetical protein [Deltaproteobacteria bacterium]
MSHPDSLPAAAIAASLLLIASCVPAAYTIPRPDQPHAIVKMRRVYHGASGETLSETAGIDGHPLFAQARPSSQAAPDTAVMRVHPVAADWQWSSVFWHVEMRWVQEAYTVYTSRLVSETNYRSESYSCGSYSSRGYASSTCYRSVPYTTMVTKQVPETHYRTVQRPVSVTDADCPRAFSFHPTVNAVYLLEYSYMGPGVCSIACLIQSSDSVGEAQNHPCSPAEFGPPRRRH